MLRIDRLSLRLPAGYEDRAEPLARAVAAELAGMPLPGSRDVARLALPPVPGAGDDAEVAARVAGTASAVLRGSEPC